MTARSKVDPSLHATEGGLQDIIGGSCHKYHFLSRQTRVCRDKTRLLSQQKYVCRDKTSILLSRQNKHTLVATKQAYFCRDKAFVATKMILVAVPANDTKY